MKPNTEVEERAKCTLLGHSILLNYYYQIYSFLSKPSQSQQFSSNTYHHLISFKKQYYNVLLTLGTDNAHLFWPFISFCITSYEEKQNMLIPKSCTSLLPLALGAPKFTVLHSIHLAALLSFTTQLPCWAPWQFIRRWQREELSTAIALMWLICWPWTKLQMFLWWALANKMPTFNYLYLLKIITEWWHYHILRSHIEESDLFYFYRVIFS